MRSFGKFTLQRKIMALILAACMVVLLLSSSIFVGSQIVTYKQLTVGELNAVADIVANNVTAAVVFDDRVSAEETLAALRAKPGIMMARIYRRDGSLFAEYTANAAPAAVSGPEEGAGTGEAPAAKILFKPVRRDELRFFDGYVDLYAPIQLDGEMIGMIFIRSDLKQMYKIIDTYLILAGFVILSLIIIALLIAGRLQKVVSKPILGLLDTMQAVSSDRNYAVRATKFGSDELGELTEGFNAMLAKIQTNDDDLRVAWHEAEAASRAKSAFLANMSHELRTPLNAIIGFSEIIKSELLGPLGTDRYRFYARDIFDSGHHLLEVINDILDISKVESGEFDLSEEDTDLREVIDQSIRLMRSQVDEARLDVATDIDPDLPHLHIDQRLIKQCLINLLSNAVKFSLHPGRITVRAVGGSDGSILLSVTDTGIGIAEEDIQKVLQPFGQVESAFSRSHGGTGLGLPLTKSFVEAHGGTLDVRSRAGKGTAVTMHFPPERVIPVPERLLAAPAT